MKQMKDNNGLSKDGKLGRHGNLMDKNGAEGKGQDGLQDLIKLLKNEMRDKLARLDHKTAAQDNELHILIKNLYELCGHQI